MLTSKLSSYHLLPRAARRHPSLILGTLTRKFPVARASSTPSSTSDASQPISSSASTSSSNYQRSPSQTSQTSSSSCSNPGSLNKSIAQLTELFQETIRVATSTGPKGIVRAIQSANAVGSLATEYLSKGQVDQPQVLLRKLFEKLGATYIKLGQFIASSPSLFPDEYVLEFQKCLDRTDPVPFSSIKQVIESELGRPWTEVYASIDPVPIASASVAQVHSAVLKDSGKPVVLKVLKPGVEDVLATDMSFVALFSKYLEFIQPDLARLSLAGILEDMRDSMASEVDFTREAKHLLHFSNFLDDRGLRGMATVPYVYTQLSSRRVLVMERLQGVALTDYEAIRSVTHREPELVLIAALNTWFASVMGCETFHADVHAGNLLVLPDGRVAFIDFGIVGRISPVTWRAMEALAGSLASADYDTMARALATIGVCQRDVDLPAFSRDLEAFFAELEQMNGSIVVQGRGGPAGPALAARLEVEQSQVNRLLLQLVRLGETHGIRFPREFGLFVKQLLYFDRYTRLLAPGLSMLTDERLNLRSLSQRYGQTRAEATSGGQGPRAPGPAQQRF